MKNIIQKGCSIRCASASGAFLQGHGPADGNMGRIIDVLSLLFCLGMAWLNRGASMWTTVWLVAAAMSFASAWLDTTGRMIAWLRTDYVKTVLRVRTAGGCTPARGGAVRTSRQQMYRPARGSRLSGCSRSACASLAASRAVAERQVPLAGPVRVVRPTKGSR